jgi:hypothetical protein
MSATITRGFSFVQGGTCNAAHLHAEIESATIAGVDRASIDRVNVTPITLSASAPAAPADKELWQNSTTLVILAWDDHFQRWTPTSPNHVLYTVDPGSSAILAGMALKLTGAGVTLAGSLTGAQSLIGIACHSAVAGGKIVFALHGILRVVITGTVVAGDLLGLSATPGVLQAAAITDRPVALAITDALGGVVWAKLKR